MPNPFFPSIFYRIDFVFFNRKVLLIIECSFCSLSSKSVNVLNDYTLQLMILGYCIMKRCLMVLYAF